MQPPPPAARAFAIAAACFVVAACAGAFVTSLVQRAPTSGSVELSLAEPEGRTWTLTPPSAWCSPPPSSEGGSGDSCSMSGAGIVLLNVSAPSQLSGTVYVDGSFAAWILPYSEVCSLGNQLTGVTHPCSGVMGPTFPSSSGLTNGSRGFVDLSTIPLMTVEASEPFSPGLWALILVDVQSTIEKAIVTSPIFLVSSSADEV